MTSCSDWLDVQPKTEVKQDKMFETESGFKDALIGCYIMMGESTLYGKELTYTFMDVLAQQYEFETSMNPYQNAKLYRYSNLDGQIERIWTNMYRIIANLNAILESIEPNREVLHPTNYANIKAEALGLRAFLHFDLLRIFGWGNIKNTPENLNKLCIPYVTRYHKDMTKQSTVKEVLEYLHKDLDEAEELLAYYDLYHQVEQEEGYELPNEDGFYDNRRSRFNYYAVKAMQARVYMWEGNYDKALEHVSFFTGDYQPVKWVDLDRSVINAAQDKRDLTFTTEHIFNLDINNMYESLKPYIEQFSRSEGVNVSQNTNYFFHSGTRAKNLYEITSGGENDQRFLAMYDQVDNAHFLFLKFKEEPNSVSPAKNKMPLIRKPEMYYYAAECYNRLGNVKKAVEMLNTVRQARGINFSYNLPETMSSDEIDQEIRKEWQKEFIGEGQMFYYYKRLGLDIPGASVSGNDAFIIPLPKKEVEMGGREDYKDNENGNDFNA